MTHMLYLAEGAEPDDGSMKDIYVLCASGLRTPYEAERIVREGRIDNLPDVTCEDCRAILVTIMERWR